MFLPSNSYAIYQLTREVSINYPSAGNIGSLFDMEKRGWSEEPMAAIGLPRSMMPEVWWNAVRSSAGLPRKRRMNWDLRSGHRCVLAGWTCGTATLGLRVFEPGVYATAIGTSMCAALIHDKPINGKGLIEWPYVYDSKRLSYSFGGSATAGTIVKWIRETCNLCRHTY